MKRKLIFILSILIILHTLTACSKDQILDSYDKVVDNAGELALTKESSLVGDKEKGKDDYTGEYAAQYEDFTGKEYIFGGTSLEERKTGTELEVKVNFKIEKGSAKLIFVSGPNVPQVIIEKDGEWSGTVKLSKGSNYFYIEAENFSGTINLNVG